MQSEKKNIIAAVVIALLFIYMGYAITACVDENGVLSIVSVMSRLSARLEKPVFLCWNQYTPGGLMYGGMLGIFFGMYFYYTRKEWMFGKEMGSAKWGDVSKLNKKLTNIKRLKREDVPYERILSRNLKMNMSDKVTRRNNNVLLIAGSGVGKTFRVVKPNILSCNGSMMITDPKQELLRDCGEYLKKNGYEIKVINLIDFENSDCYNPFAHLKDESALPEFIELFWSSMDDKTAQKGDPVWEQSAKSLIESLAYYMFLEMTPEKRTFRTLAGLFETLSSDKGLKNMEKTMRALQQNDERHPAASKYLNVMNGAENTVRSVLFSATAKMSRLTDEKLLRIFDHDTIDFKALGMGYKDNPNKKTALFFCIKDGDTRWNFVATIAIMQAFTELEYEADNKCKHNRGKLPIPVSAWLDEFANVPLPNDYPKKLAVMRGRNINSIIVLQDISQLEVLYEKNHKSVRANCDTWLYLGGNEHETQKMISEKLGKKTTPKRSTGVSRGAHGSESSNEDIVARDLMTPDEVALMDERKEIIFVRGHRPIMDFMYQTETDPRFIESNKLKAYEHVPNRGVPREGGKKEEELKPDKKVEIEPISTAEAENLVKSGAKLNKLGKQSETDTTQPQKTKYDLSGMEGYERLSEKQKTFLFSVLASGKMTLDEVCDMFTADTDLKSMKIVADQWHTEKDTIGDQPTE